MTTEQKSPDSIFNKLKCPHRTSNDKAGENTHNSAEKYQFCSKMMLGENNNQQHCRRQGQGQAMSALHWE